MEAEIGSAAGDVYRYLDESGPATVSQLKKATGRRDADIHQAIGWLAREGKVVHLRKGKSTHWGIARA
jgi:hypothetical protein